MTRILTTYAASRERFRSRLSSIAQRWPQARLSTFPVPSPQGEDLTIDLLRAPAEQPPQHLLLVTTGEHGIECLAGAALLDLVMEQLLPALDPRTTSLCLVHCINPWGMAHGRRTNAANVDLNRNFVTGWDTVERHNAGYQALKSMFQPSGAVPPPAWDRLHLAGSVLGLALTGRAATLRQALLTGQYDEPEGLYYGGTGWQPETAFMRGVYSACLHGTPHLVHIDLHTGYGPRWQMSVVNSGLDPVPSTLWSQRIGYPRVVAATHQEFYRIEGDMIDYMYRARQSEAPGIALYATCFEFGCLGDSMKAELDSLWCAIAENRLRRYGATGERDAAAIRQFWHEAYCPSDPAWEEKACADVLTAFRGILRDQGMSG